MENKQVEQSFYMLETILGKIKNHPYDDEKYLHIIKYIDSYFESINSNIKNFNNDLVEIKKSVNEFNSQFYILNELVSKQIEIMEANLIAKLNDYMFNQVKNNNQSQKNLDKQITKLNEKIDTLQKINEIENNINDIANNISIILNDYIKDNESKNNGNRVSGCIF